MDFGKIEYVASGNGNGNGKKPVRLRLTLIGQGDGEALEKGGLAALRRKRILRLAEEARGQGFALGYKDLSGLLFTSLATVKRDVRQIEEQGSVVPLKGRRKGPNGGPGSGGVEGLR